METGCVFCALVKGHASAEVIYEDEVTLPFMDINPATRGHTLVIPKRRFRDVYDIEEEAGLAAMKTAIKVARAVKIALQPDGLNILQANEPGGFQSVLHWKGDGLIRPWQPERGDEEEIRETARLIREQSS